MIALLSGCASLSREQCLHGNWYSIGMADGRAGLPTERLDLHSRACSEYGIRVDTQQYLDGYAQGLGEYCRLENAFESGLQGRRYQHVCPPEIDALFDRYNRAAYEVYRIKRDLDRLEVHIDSLEFQLRDRGLTAYDRNQLRSDLRELDRRYMWLRSDLYSSRRSLDQLMHEVGINPFP
jgi:hypothetical protein